MKSERKARVTLSLALLSREAARSLGAAKVEGELRATNLRTGKSSLEHDVA
jgi:hypothetical protein